MEFASACVFALYIFGGRERRPTGTEDDACCHHSWRCTRRPPRGWRWGSPRKRSSAWVKLCSKNEQTGNKQLCLVKYEELDPTDTGLRQIIVVQRKIVRKLKAKAHFGRLRLTLRANTGEEVAVELSKRQAADLCEQLNTVCHAWSVENSEN